MRTSSYLTGCVICSRPTAHPEDRGIQLCEACAKLDLIQRGGLTGTVEPEPTLPLECLDKKSRDVLK